MNLFTYRGKQIIKFSITTTAMSIINQYCHNYNYTNNDNYCNDNKCDYNYSKYQRLTVQLPQNTESTEGQGLIGTQWTILPWQLSPWVGDVWRQSS